jgi:hypothetical protein
MHKLSVNRISACVEFQLLDKMWDAPTDLGSYF